jgi:outer membrane cobalamin receptor
MLIPCLWRPAAACRLPITIAWFALLLTRSASAATLAGHVVDPDGRPVAGAHVIVSTANGTLIDRATSDDGRFEIVAMPAGEYDVRIVADGLTADPTRVVLTRDDRQNIDLKLHVSAITESVVVSGSHVDVPLSRSADSVTVITSAELQARQIETVADALRLVPGLTVARSGDRGALTSLFPRGGGSNYTLVLVDGIRATAFGGGFDFGHLAVADVDRIEIVRGPESAIFGADAIGAVVQIITRRGGPFRVDGLVEGGSQGTARVGANAAGSRGAWSWGGGAERTRSDGFTGIAPACRVPGTCVPGGDRVMNDDDHMTHGSGTIGWQRGDGYDLLISGNLQRDERGTPGAFGSNPIGAYRCVDRLSRGVNDTRQIGSRFLHPWSTRVRERIEATYLDISSQFAAPAFLPPLFDPCNFTDPPSHSSSGTRRFDGRVQEDLTLSPEVAASIGVEFLRERGSSTYITNATGSPIDINRGVIGSFAELRYVGRERLFVTGGGRIEHLTRDGVPGDGFGSRPAFPNQTINSFNPKIAASFLASGSKQSGLLTRLHASAGTGIRPPNTFEIAFTDNPNLKPERSRSFDAGIEQQLGNGRYVFGATAFLNRYDDLLVTVGRSLESASRYKTDNISNARASGLELSGDARPVRTVRLRASYTFLDSETLSVDGIAGTAPPPFKVGQPLIRRPRHQGEFDIVYARGRVTAFGELTTRSQVLDIEPNEGALFGGLFFSPGFSVVNTGASLHLVRGLEVYARVMNLTDRQYEEVFGFPALRRSGIIGIRVGPGR